MKKRNWLLILIIIAAAGCKKPYNPSVISAPAGSYLVVEGVINSGNDSTFIKLSRTVKLSGNAAVNPELNAVVTVESDQNTSYPLTEMGNGNYSTAGLNLDNSHKYRLSIKTAGNKQYLSDYMAVLNSPPIDSISYDTRGNVSTMGLNIYATTHDQSNGARYYRWDYQETWVFHSNFTSYYKSNGDTVLLRDLQNDDISTCWKSDISSSLALGSSAKLSQNVIADNPITFIVSTDEKLSDTYSILVKQYALTPDAYNFFVNLKKNTEQLGSIFDAQPSEIGGNIHSVTDPSEPVIGYVCVGSTSSQRIFIKKQTLPAAWSTAPFYSDCHLALDPEEPKSSCCYYVFFNPQGYKESQVDKYINYNSIYFHPGGDNPLIPVGAIGLPAHPPIGYTAASRSCTDCTLRGTNKKPAFWQ